MVVSWWFEQYVPLMSKDKLRQEFLQHRQALRWMDWQRKSQAICQQIQALPWFIQAVTILAYSPHQQEPDICELFQTYSMSKKWGLPRIQGKTLMWHRFWPGQAQQLRPDRYGILTPPVESPVISAPEVDLILVPCVAVDRQGYRLGYGGGYYDRMLAEPAWHTVKTLGIVFESACVEKLPTQAWDIPLNGYCSEHQTVMIKPQDEEAAYVH